MTANLTRRVLAASFVVLLGFVAPVVLRAAPTVFTDEECAQYGRQIAAYYSTGQQAELVRQLDVFAYLDRVSRDFGYDDKEQGDFRAGATEGLNKNLTAQFSQFNNARYLRKQVVDGETRLLVRCLSDSGAVNYLAFIVERRKNGSLKWIDVFIYLSGETMSDTTRRMVLPLVASQKRSLLEKLTTKETVYVQNFPKIMEAATALQKGNPAPALKTLNSLPPELARDRSVLLLRLRAAQAEGGDTYLKVISDWETAYPGDPSLSLISLDGDVMRKDYDKAIAHIETLATRLGGDAYLDYLRGNVYLMAGNHAEAKRAARAAVTTEPELSSAWDTLLNISIADKKYDETAQLLAEFGRLHPHADLKGIVDSETSYADFRKSDAYQTWISKSAGAATK